MKMRRVVLALVLGWITALGLRANELTLFKVFPNCEMASAGVGGLRSTNNAILSGPIVITNIPPGSTIIQAILYFHGPKNDTTALPVSASVNGAVYTGTTIGFSDANCYTEFGLINSRACRVDVTAAVNEMIAATGSADGTYTVTNLQPLGPNVNGASLLIFYQDGNPADYRDFWVFDGNDSNVGTSWDAFGWNLFMGPFSYAGGPVNLQLHVSDGQTYIDGAVYLNNRLLLPVGHNYDGNTVTNVSNPFGNGGLWDITNYDVTSFMTNGQTVLTLTMGNSADCLSLVAAVLGLPVSGSPPPTANPNNLAPTFLTCPDSYTAEASMASGYSTNVLSAVVADPEGDALLVQWSITGGAIAGQTGGGTGSLMASQSYPATAPNTPETNTVVVALAPGTYTVTATVTDFNSSPQVCSYNIFVKDPIPPTIVCPTNDTPAIVTNTGTFPLPDLTSLVKVSDDVTPPNLIVVTQSPPAGTPVSLGEISVTFTAKDQALNTSSCQAVILLRNLSVPVAPVARNDAFVTAENAPLTISAASLLSNDTDPLGDPLAVTGVTQPSNGTLVNNGNGTYTYTPAANFLGADSFTYTVTDTTPAPNGGGTATATVTISVVTPPVAVNDTASVNEGQSVAIDVLANDYDPNHYPISVVAVTPPAHGTVSAPGNPITYTPAPLFYGTDTFTYTIANTLGGRATATVTVTVNPGPPIAVADTATTPENTAVLIDVLSNDVNIAGLGVTITSVTTPAHGTAAISSDRGVPAVLYTPNAWFYGPDSFSYTISDNEGTSSASVSVNVTFVNQPPVANPDSAFTLPGQAVNINVLANDTDIDGDNSLFVLAVTQPAHGTVVNNTGNVTYTPLPGFVGTDTFTYTVSDGHETNATATATVTVRVDSPPVAAPDQAITITQVPVTIPVLANDTDPLNYPIHLVSVAPAINGTTVANPDGTVTYTSSAGFVGTDAFTYVVADPYGAQATGTVTVTVVSGHCDLYPIALSVLNVANAKPGDTITNILNGVQPGNFGWLTWTGDQSEPTLAKSLTPPGNSSTYINPSDPTDHLVSLGDWIVGDTGVQNSSAVRAALNTLETMDITVPVWDQSVKNGANTLYHVVNFARVRITSYQLPKINQITVIFRGFALCGDQITAPPASSPPGKKVKGGSGGDQSEGSATSSEDDASEGNSASSGSERQPSNSSAKDDGAKQPRSD